MACLGAYQKLPRLYQSQASVVLLASKAAAKANGGNPYLSFTPSLTLAADVLSREMMAPATSQDLMSRGFTDPYTVALATYATQTTGSVLDVAVTGDDPAGVQRTLLAVSDELRSKLVGMQAGLHPSGRIQAVTLAITRQPQVSLGHTARSIALLGGVGLLLSLGVPWLIDAQVTQRRLRRAAAPDADPELPGDDHGDDGGAADDGWADAGQPTQSLPALTGSDEPPGRWPAGHTSGWGRSSLQRVSAEQRVSADMGQPPRRAGHAEHQEREPGVDREREAVEGRERDGARGYRGGQ
jgi:hypothetical protein